MIAICANDSLANSGTPGSPHVGPLSEFPEPVQTYSAHVAGGLSLRQVARIRAKSPSTILRQVRRIEQRRDDALFDEALDAVGRAALASVLSSNPLKEWTLMLNEATTDHPIQDREVQREARRILRRLCEKDAFLALARDMNKAVVMREAVPGRHTRTGVVSREIAQKFALNDWIECQTQGRIARYVISNAGRSALKRMLEEDRQAKMRKTGKITRITPFVAQHQDVAEPRKLESGGATKPRVNLAESPLTILARKVDRTGVPYLSGDLVEAGERLREDFEIAQMGPRVTQNWENFLAHGDISSSTGGTGTGPEEARRRVAAALSALGPGLSDVAFRVCCFLEGLETAEKRLGWSARSAKVVLRIALQRLAQHYGITPAAQDQAG